MFMEGQGFSASQIGMFTMSLLIAVNKLYPMLGYRTSCVNHLFPCVNACQDISKCVNILFICPCCYGIFLLF